MIIMPLLRFDRYSSKEQREAGNHGNTISEAVVRKMISDHRKQERTDWFSELVTVKKTLAVCKEGKHKKYPGFVL